MQNKIKDFLHEPLYYVAAYIFLLALVFVPVYSYNFDTYCFHSWCSYIFQHGLTKAYHNLDPDFNYPPLIGYFYLVFGKLAGTQQNIDRYFYFFKTFALLFDFVSAILIVNLVANNKWKIFWFLLLAANPVFIYNSYYWGQYDAVLSGFILLSFIFLLREKLTLGALFFLLAINFKVQAIVFVPPLGLLALYQFWKKTSIKEFVLCLCTCLAVQLLILLPFIVTGEMAGVLRAYTGSVSYYPEVSKTAYNIWYLMFGNSAFKTHDTEVWMGVSLKVWGLLMFCTASFLAMLPLLYPLLSKMFFKKPMVVDRNNLFILFALIPLLFFFLNTQMHERYSHPAFVFIALFSFAARKYYLLVIMCMAYFGNLEPACHSFALPNYKILVFEPVFIACLYFTLIIALFFYLYNSFIVTLKRHHA